MKQKLLASILIVAMLFSCVPMAAMASERQPIEVDGMLIFYDNNVYRGYEEDSVEDYVEYDYNLVDAESLEEMGITTGSAYILDGMNILGAVSTVVYILDDAEVVLNGENNMQGYIYDEESAAYGIQANELTITGNGALTVSMEDNEYSDEPQLLSLAESESKKRIAVSGDLIVKSGTVIMQGGSAGETIDSYGFEGTLTVVGGTVILQGNTKAYLGIPDDVNNQAPKTIDMDVYASENYDGTGKIQLTNWVGDGSDDVSAYKYLELKPSTGTTNPSTPPNSGGSNGFNGVYNYPIIVLPTAGADVEASEDFAKAGEVITITADLAQGRRVDTVVVTDADDNKLTVTEVNPVEYTFVMPASEATVAVTTAYDSDAVKHPVEIIMQIGNCEIIVNGVTIQHDVPPTLVNDRTMLPIAIVAETLGADVDWDADARKVTITKDDIVIELFVDEYYAYFNGEKKVLDAAPYIEDNRTYLPVRFVSEHLGADVHWDGATRTVTITAK